MKRSTKLDLRNALVEYAETGLLCSVTTLQAVTWAGTARRIPRRLSSAEEQYARYCALGQG